uniref:Uncharacterized protein n=1 Tax=Tetraselmis sp. GSL018 TaxID=582737 RepID=A0A061REK2_9CHLO
MVAEADRVRVELEAVLAIVGELEGDQQRLQQVNEELRASREEALAQLRAAAARLEALGAEVTGFQREAAAERGALRTALGEAREEAEQLRQLVQEFAAEHSVLAAAHREATDGLEALNRSLADTHEKLGTLLQKKSSLEGQLALEAAVRGEAEAAAESDRDRLQSLTIELQEVRGAAERLTEMHQRLSADHEALQAVAADLEEAKGAAEAELRSAVGRAEEAGVAKAMGKLKGLSEKLERSCEAVGTAERLRVLAASRATQELSAMEGELGRLGEEGGRLTSVNSELQALRSRAESELSMAARRLEAVEVELAEARAAAERASADRDAAEAAAAAQRLSALGAWSEVRSLKEQLDRLREEVSRCFVDHSGSLTELSQAVAKAEANSAGLVSVLEAIEQELKGAEAMPGSTGEPAPGAEETHVLAEVRRLVGGLGAACAQLSKANVRIHELDKATRLHEEKEASLEERLRDTAEQRNAVLGRAAALESELEGERARRAEADEAHRSVASAVESLRAERAAGDAEGEEVRKRSIALRAELRALRRAVLGELPGTGTVPESPDGVVGGLELAIKEAAELAEELVRERSANVCSSEGFAESLKELTASSETAAHEIGALRENVSTAFQRNAELDGLREELEVRLSDANRQIAEVEERERQLRGEAEEHGRQLSSGVADPRASEAAEEACTAQPEAPPSEAWAVDGQQMIGQPEALLGDKPNSSEQGRAAEIAEELRRLQGELEAARKEKGSLGEMAALLSRRMAAAGEALEVADGVSAAARAGAAEALQASETERAALSAELEAANAALAKAEAKVSQLVEAERGAQEQLRGALALASHKGHRQDGRETPPAWQGAALRMSELMKESSKEIELHEDATARMERLRHEMQSGAARMHEADRQLHALDGKLRALELSRQQLLGAAGPAAPDRRASTEGAAVDDAPREPSALSPPAPEGHRLIASELEDVERREAELLGQRDWALAMKEELSQELQDTGAAYEDVAESRETLNRRLEALQACYETVEALTCAGPAVAGGESSAGAGGGGSSGVGSVVGEDAAPEQPIAAGVPLAEFRDAKRALEAKLRSVSVVKEELTGKNADLVAQLHHEREWRSAIESERSGTQSQLNQLVQQRREAHREAESLTLSLVAVRAEKAELSTRCRETQQRAAEAEARAAGLEKARALLERQLADVEDREASGISDREAGIRLARQRISDLTEELQDVRAELRARDTACGSLEAAKAEAEHRLATVTSELETLRTDAQSRSASAEAELRAAEESVEELRAAEEEAQRRVQFMKDEKERLELALAAEKRNSKALSASKAAIQMKHSSAAAQLERKTAELGRLREEADALASRVKQLQAEKDFLAGAKQELEDVKARERAELNRAVAQIEGLTAQLEASRESADHEAEARRRLEEAVQAEHRRSEGAEHRLQAVVAERNSLAAAHADLGSDLLGILEMLKALDEEVRALTGSRDDLVSSLEDGSAALSAAGVTCAQTAQDAGSRSLLLLGSARTALHSATDGGGGEGVLEDLRGVSGQLREARGSVHSGLEDAVWKLRQIAKSMAGWQADVIDTSEDDDSGEDEAGEAIAQVRASFHLASSIVASVQAKLDVLVQPSWEEHRLRAINAELEEKLQAAEAAVEGLQRHAQAVPGLLAWPGDLEADGLSGAPSDARGGPGGAALTEAALRELRASGAEAASEMQEQAERLRRLGQPRSRCGGARQLKRGRR